VAKNQEPTIVAEIPDTGRLKVTSLDDGASHGSLAGSWIELET
jgi:hypothetical protein